ncbi:MAG: glutamate 5-kinase [Dehalococcoidia bacterium]|nr:glutamate 5-kinase [Dehalococcoidia bacterium]
MPRVTERRIVVKLGTTLLTSGRDHLDLSVMATLVEQLGTLHSRGRELIVVSSGAVAAGRERLRRRDASGMHGTPLKQVLASIGQSHLMSTYEMLFSRHDITIAQALLTRDSLMDRAGYLNARNTLLALCEMRVICIVNENDVIAVDELGDRRFGDNDNLSAMVANLVDADLLVLLTDTGGLYSADPRIHPEAKLIPVVGAITAEIEALAGGSLSGQGVGGMSTKVEAAKLATCSGIDVVVASGREPDVLQRLDSGERIGTLFPASSSKLESRKRWMASGLASHGRIVVDGGAVGALKKGTGSLLPAGIVDVKGTFHRGDIVDIVSEDGGRVASGIANYQSEDVRKVRGKRSDAMAGLLDHLYGAEVVHRNNMVVL